MNIFKKARRLSPARASEAGLYVSAAILLVLGAVFISGGGIERVGGALAHGGLSAFTGILSNTQTASLLVVGISATSNTTNVAPGSQAVITFSGQNIDYCWWYASPGPAGGVPAWPNAQFTHTGYLTTGNSGSFGTGALAGDTTKTIYYIAECENQGGQNHGYSGVCYVNGSPSACTSGSTSATPITFQPSAPTQPPTQPPAQQSVPTGTVAACPPPNYTGCSGSVSIAANQKAYVGASFAPASGQSLTASAIVTNTPAQTNPDTYGSYLRCDARNGCNVQSLGGYFTPSGPGTYQFWPTEADTSHAWKNWNGAPATIVTVSSTCSNGLSYYSYPSCACPFGMKQSGSSCVQNITCSVGPAATSYTAGSAASIAYTTSGSPSSLTIYDNGSLIYSTGSPPTSGTVSEAGIAAGSHTVTGSAGGVACSAGPYGSTYTATASYDFSISAPSTAISQGTSGSVTVSATRLSGSASTYIYSFLAVGAPSGVSFGAFSPSSCTPTNASCTTAPITVSGSAAAGSYPITIYAYDQTGSIVRTATFSLTVKPSSTFNFSLYPGGTVTVASASSAQTSIGASVVSGTPASIGSFTSTGAPSGMSVSFSPSACTPPTASCTTATFAANSSVAPGTYTVYVYGTSGGSTASTPVTVTVSGLPELSITASDNAGEAGTGQGTGTFVLSRTGGSGLSAALPVLYAVSGTATYGTDYTLGGTCASIGLTGATIPANLSSCTVIVTPIEDTLQESAETITITLKLPS